MFWISDCHSHHSHDRTRPAPLCAKPHLVRRGSCKRKVPFAIRLGWGKEDEREKKFEFQSLFLWIQNQTSSRRGAEMNIKPLPKSPQVPYPPSPQGRFTQEKL